MPLYTGFIQLGAGLSVGLAGLAAGFAIGIVGDAGVRGTAQQPRLFVGMVSLECGVEVNWARVGKGRESTDAAEWGGGERVIPIAPWALPLDMTRHAIGGDFRQYDCAG